MHAARPPHIIEMHRFLAFRRMAVLWPFLPFAFLAPGTGRAADPQPYEFIARPAGDPALDAAVRDGALLLSLRDKAPVGGFALAVVTNL